MLTPTTLQIGDTWGWTATVAEYSATEWVLKFAFRGYGLSVIDITATADGDDFTVTVPAGITAAYTKGVYQWTAQIEKGTEPSIERYTVGSGTVTLLPYLGAATGATDNRSHARKMLDAIETALIASVASGAHIASITVNGKSVTYKRDGLEQAAAYWRRRVAIEEGKDFNVRIQFGSA